jgi:site-specific DNA recombinase
VNFFTEEKLKLIVMIKEELNLPKGKGQLNFTKIEEVQNKEEANRLLTLMVERKKRNTSNRKG